MHAKMGGGGMNIFTSNELPLTQEAKKIKFVGSISDVPTKFE